MRRTDTKANRKRKRTLKGHYIMELILIGNGVLPKERLDYELGYPSNFKKLIKNMEFDNWIKKRELDGSELVMVSSIGLTYVKNLKKKKPEVFDRNWSERCTQRGIDIDNFIIPR